MKKWIRNFKESFVYRHSSSFLCKINVDVSFFKNGVHIKSEFLRIYIWNVRVKIISNFGL